MAGFHGVRERRGDTEMFFPVTAVEFVVGDRAPAHFEARLYLDAEGIAPEILLAERFMYFVPPERAAEISTGPEIPEFWRHSPAECELINHRIMLSGVVVCDLYRAVIERNRKGRDLARCAAEGHA